MGMPMEPMWLPTERRTASKACRRCGSPHVRDLGDAGSNLRWFACLVCCYVWGIGESGSVAAPSSSEWPKLARN